MSRSRLSQSRFSSGFSGTGVSGPVLPLASNLTATVLDETSASLTVSVNKNAGDIFGVAINTATGTIPPSAAQVLAGQDGSGAAVAWDHNQGVSSTGTQTFAGGITGLTEGQTYRAYAVFRDSDLAVSAVQETGNFIPADVTAPFISSLDLTNDGADNWTGTVNTDTGEGLLDVVITTSATQPSAAQIILGRDHNGAVAAGAVLDQVVSTANVQNLTGNNALSGSTSYWGHAVHTDVAGNPSNVLTTATSFTTDAGSGLVFTDDLADGGGTPVAITTTITPRQAFQRDRANITLAGTYSVTGGDPTSMAWRVDTGDWVAFTSETIGSGNWSGTLSIPATYLAQGTLEVKPVNGLNVTPATVADITVTDVFALLGDSMTAGLADTADTYTKTNFDWIIFDGTDFNVTTSQTSIWPSLAEGLDAVGVPPVFIQYGSSGSAFRPHLGGSAGGSWHPSPTNGDTDFYYSTALTRLNAIDAGGFKALIWEQGPNDAIDNNTFYEQDLKDLIDAYQANAENFAGVKMLVSILGEVDENETGLADVAHLDAMRTAQISAINTDADILRGPSWLDLDFGDGVHFGKAPAGIAQQQLGGDRWWRAVQTHFYGGALPLTGPAISSVTVSAVNTLTVTFDQAVTNHTDATGWKVQDGTGVVAVSSAAQGGSTSEVVLTLASDLRTNSGGVEAVLVSFGEGNDAVASTLRSTDTPYAPPEFTVDADAGEAYAFNTAVPTLDGTPTVGVAVTCDGGTWESVSSITYTYQWRESDGGAAISGATSASYTPVAGDSAYLNTMICDVTATNTKGAVTATSTTGGYSPATAFNGGKAGGWWAIEDTGSLWQDVAASTAVSADADPVARVDDSGPNSNHLLQSDNALRMAFDTGDTYQNLNGDGSADYLQTANFTADGDILMIVAADFTAATGTVLSFTNSSSTAQFIHLEHNRVRHASNDFGSNSSITMAPTGRSVVTVVGTESDKTFRVYVNGVEVGTGTKAGSGWFDTSSTSKAVGLGLRSFLGTPDHNAGAIYGALTVVGASVAAERAELETYFGNLIGLSL